MKRNSTLGLAIAAFALVLSACSSNLTVTKRHYNKGWNISLGGGKAGQFERPTRLERVAHTEVQSEVAPIQEAISISEANASVSAMSVAVNAPVATVASKSVPAKAQKSVTKAATKIVAKSKSENNAPVLKAASEASSNNGYSQWIALGCCILLGALGIHRFYLGYYLEGVLFILTAGGCGIWWIIDLVRILTGDLGPADGSGYTEEI